MKKKPLFHKILFCVTLLAFTAPCVSVWAADVLPAPAASPIPAPPTHKEQLQQNLDNANKSNQPVTPDPYANLPDEYITEAKVFYQGCQLNANFYDYHDCKCLASKYLDKRIELGPDALGPQIQSQIEDQCRDATRAAGVEYDKCVQNAVLMPVSIPIEEYCTCFANTYAKLFEQSNARANSKTFVEFQTQAHVRCQDPALAKKLYLNDVK